MAGLIIRLAACAALVAGALAALGLGLAAASNRQVECLAIGQLVDISYESRGSLHTERVRVGDDWGKLAANQGDYGCMGRCGPGCPSHGSGTWTRDCLIHDVCSYRNTSRRGPLDPSCGARHLDTFDDVAASLVGAARCEGAPLAGTTEAPPP